MRLPFPSTFVFPENDMLQCMLVLRQEVRVRQRGTTIVHYRATSIVRPSGAGRVHVGVPPLRFTHSVHILYHLVQLGLLPGGRECVTPAGTVRLQWFVRTLLRCLGSVPYSSHAPCAQRRSRRARGARELRAPGSSLPSAPLEGAPSRPFLWDAPAPSAPRRAWGRGMQCPWPYGGGGLGRLWARAGEPREEGERPTRGDPAMRAGLTRPVHERAAGQWGRRLGGGLARGSRRT